MTIRVLERDLDESSVDTVSPEASDCWEGAALWPQVGWRRGLLGIGTRTRARLAEWCKTEQRLSKHDQTGPKISLRGKFDNGERRHMAGLGGERRGERGRGGPLFSLDLQMPEQLQCCETRRPL